MATILNAVSGTGLTQTADGSGVIKLQSNGVTTNALAWVNFNGTSATPITPRANYNISSVTKNGTGDYTLNFTSALSDANYTVAFNNKADSASYKTMYEMGTIGTPIRTVNAFRMVIINQAQVVADADQVNVAVFGN
jgi:hypothetical protein